MSLTPDIEFPRNRLSSSVPAYFRHNPKASRNLPTRMEGPKVTFMRDLFYGFVKQIMGFRLLSAKYMPKAKRKHHAINIQGFTHTA
jgi:hypothetical protein